jgi:hypothetical protein
VRSRSGQAAIIVATLGGIDMCAAGGPQALGYAEQPCRQFRLPLRFSYIASRTRSSV